MRIAHYQRSQQGASNISEWKKTITQWTAKHIAIALALILPGNISDMRRQGTGPAPRANDSTYLHCIFHFTFRTNIIKHEHLSM